MSLYFSCYSLCFSDAVFFEGVQSAELSYDDLKQQILNSGTVVFIDLLEKVRN